MGRLPHAKIKELIYSSDKLFQNFTTDDMKQLSAREAPLETKADKILALHLSKGIARIAPNENVVVEDGPSIIVDSSAPTWVIDPIDGTIPFKSHIPTYTVSIYRVSEGVIDAAYAYNPVNKDMYSLESSQTYVNSQPIKVSEHSKMIEAQIVISGHVLETIPSLYTALREAGAYVIVQEGLVFRSALVANGFVDATIQVDLRKYESGTVYGLVVGSGGLVSSPTKRSIDFLETTHNVVISNAALHDELLFTLEKVLNVQETGL